LSFGVVSAVEFRDVTEGHGAGFDDEIVDGYFGFEIFLEGFAELEDVIEGDFDGGVEVWDGGFRFRETAADNFAHI